MRVLVLGASGGVGQHLVRIAAERGHEVTAAARSALALPAGARLVIGDVCDPGFVASAVAGQGAVLSSLGLRRRSPNPFSPLTSPADFSSRSARALVDAMRAQGVRRVLAVSASGVGDSRPGLNLMMRFMVAATTIGKMYADLEGMEQVYAQSGLDWCCVRPTGLTDSPRTGAVKVIPDFPLTARIARADVAAWMVDHLEGDLSALRTPTITG